MPMVLLVSDCILNVLHDSKLLEQLAGTPVNYYCD